MKSKFVARKDLSVALGSLQPQGEFMVSSSSDRQEALRIGKNFIDAGLVHWKLKTWDNGDGTFTIRAIQPRTK